MDRIKVVINSQFYQDQIDALAELKKQDPQFSRAQWMRDAIDEKLGRKAE